MNKAYQGNIKQLKKQMRLQEYRQKEHDAQIMERLDAVDKSLKQITAYLSKLASYIDSRTEVSEAAILQAVSRLDKKSDHSELQTREILKLLLADSLAGKSANAPSASAGKKK